MLFLKWMESVSKSYLSTELRQKSKVKLELRWKLKLLEMEKKEFSIIRAKISNPSVELEISGVWRFWRYRGSTTKLDLWRENSPKKLSKKAISKVILDLRGNGGGYVTAAQSVASLWLEKNSLIVTEKSGSKVVDEVRATGFEEAKYVSLWS